MIADASAVEVASTNISLLEGQDAIAVFNLGPDFYTKRLQLSKTWGEMIEPSLYLSVESGGGGGGAAALTYGSDGPKFGIKPGDSIKMVLRAK
eukprot:CAMPEP_0183325852 /NCGR_PEP_ID=MMETSP0160_2-20130417/80694_1 /TAXON_ID=2839 ORGANISM="Odontella Sinensis, Strain Grunow 1884" /NCGR_SAMPLE_ID=MMETSP0160_2 /ASSEMBLY_ACC=CAM_ASM_000250 /LENGTH=92 /DNA_ID=CAMNT_0025493733 /DNA_START=261 /DNA_END=539 /DNA_ORIENTATION=-